ncbi:MAG: hypothetical protein N4A68_12805, partial [Maledivibacter sp.]|nr:hypothetical protein [Maledivibacter sp.]
MKLSITSVHSIFKGYLQNINLGKVLVVMLCVIVISQGFLINPSYADPVTKTMTINFTEDMNQSKSKTITIPNLKSIVDVSVNTGNVSHSVDGENITFSVSGGSPSRQEYNPKKYSKQVTDSKTQGNSSFSSTMQYDDGEYSGTINKTGSSLFISGTPGDNKEITMNTYVNEYERKKVTRINRPGDYDVDYLDNSYEWDDPRWKHVHGCGVGETTNHPLQSSRFSYTDNYGYTGVLGDRNCSNGGHDNYDWPDHPSVGDIFKTRCNTWEISYRGRIYKPDTRRWKQSYTGTVYKGGYDDYYGYTVTLKYTDNSNPTINITEPFQNEYFSKKVGHNSISIKGNVKDDDAGDNLTVYYSILDRSNNPVLGHENINIDSFLANGNTQSFSNYGISVDDSLSQGNNNIKIWCEDDKGGKSNEITRSFTVDNTGPTSNVPTVKAISNTEIQITPNANDPSNLNVAPFLYNREDSDITSWIN